MFTRTRTTDLPVLKANLEEYVVEATGTRHLHLQTQEPELSFLVGFPTCPTVSDGRAHILEHLALCGSENYPVADPFFSMMRRSTATFMNAMTYADRTVYPFATTDRTDFFNLMDVYLDATFFPKLDYLSFLQEGWRYSWKNGTLSMGGVVLNEMKGVYQYPMRALQFGLEAHLFEKTTYAIDSGGDPLVIPELTHEALLEYHRTHYHPSQAFFLTAGNIDAAAIQEQIASRVLSKLPGRQAVRVPELSPPWSVPKFVEICIPSQEARADEFGVQLAWRLDESRDALSTLRLRLLARALVGDASAPVLKAMESLGFGRPSQMTGVDSQARQLALHIGMEGLTEDQVELAQKCIQVSLQKAASAGVPTEIFEAAIRDMRFSQREVRGGRLPDALSRLLDAVPFLIYGSDVLPALDNEASLQTLEKEFSDPRFFKRLLRELLDNNNFLIAKIVPYADYTSSRSAIEEERLRAKALVTSQDELRRFVEEEEALAKHRKDNERPDLLPRIAPQDVSEDPRKVPEVKLLANGATTVEVASNGVTYATLSYDVSHFDETYWPWLSLYCNVVESLGVGDRTYEQAAAWRQQLVPMFSVYLDALTQENDNSLRLGLHIAASGLAEKNQDITDVITAWALAPRFDETQRIAFLVRSRVDDLLATLSDNGNQLAQWQAAAAFAPQKRFRHHSSGVASLPFWQSLKAELKTDGGPENIAAMLSAVHGQLVATASRVIWISSAEQPEAVESLVNAIHSKRVKGHALRMPTGPALDPVANSALVFSGQVNFCHDVREGPCMSHVDAPSLAVAAELMTNRILHRRLREEGGAYGGMATYSAEDGVFIMSSYRDPRLEGTYADFEAAVAEVLTADFTQEQIDEAILSVIRAADRPLSPQQQGLEADRLARRGVSNADRVAYRSGVLKCSLAQVRCAAERWLMGKPVSRCAAAANAEQALAGLTPVDMLQFTA